MISKIKIFSIIFSMALLVLTGCAQKYAKKRIESGDVSDAWWPKLHSISVGLEGSPDLESAQKVADYLESFEVNREI